LDIFVSVYIPGIFGGNLSQKRISTKGYVWKIRNLMSGLTSTTVTSAKIRDRPTTWRC